MTLAHTAGAGHDGVPLPAAVLLGVLAAAYLAGVVACRRRDRDWPVRRTVSFLTGVGLLAAALLPPLAADFRGHIPPAADFRGHMAQHLLVGMVAPLPLMLGAPVTLALRALPPPYARRLGRALRSPPVHLVANPFTALLLSLGGLVALYFTPLYAAVAGDPALHQLVHVHFLAAGYLFAWVIAGPDPAPRRPSVPVRLVVLAVAVAGHALTSQLIYAGVWVRVPASPEQLRAAGELMYYGGDLAELLLALVLLSSWRSGPLGSTGRGTEASRTRRGRR